MRCIAALLASSLLGGCGTLSRLSEVGRPPELDAVQNPTGDPSYRPLTMPMPSPQIPPATADSLWRPGSRAFFKDQRAANVGDIVTVLVNIADTASFDNASSANRSTTEAMGVPNLFGLETYVPTFLHGALANSLISVNSNGTNTGTGAIKRVETVTVRLAGVVTQVMANGNLVVAAHQQVRVNSELRDMTVSGVIRPQDIASDNTVQHDRMAEARISYGGRGQLTNVQTPRYGQQVLDTLSPF